MKEIAVEMIGQKRVRVDYDYGVIWEDLEKQFKKGQECLAELGEEVNRAGSARTFRVEDCLVDNILDMHAFGQAHGFLIVGFPEQAAYVKERLEFQVPRVFPSMPSYVENPGRIESNAVYKPGNDFDLASFHSASEAFKALNGLKAAS